MLITLSLVFALVTEPATGKIKCYRDSQGVWWIGNLGTEGQAGSASPVGAQVTDPATAAAPVPPPVAHPSAPINCVVDGRGVIRITNVKANAERNPRLASDGATAERLSRQSPGQGSTSLIKAKDGLDEGLQVAAQLARFAGRTDAGTAPARIKAERTQRYGKIYLIKDGQGRYFVYNLTNPAEKGAERSGLAGERGLEPLINLAAKQHQLEPSLIKAVIKAESNFNLAARSPKGAVGLMQLMPGTADFLGLKDPRCPVENIIGGSRYLRLLLDCFHGDLELALAAYNAGFQRVIQSGFQVPGIKETEDFVKRVLRYFQEYRTQNQDL